MAVNKIQLNRSFDSMSEGITWIAKLYGCEKFNSISVSLCCQEFNRTKYITKHVNIDNEEHKPVAGRPTLVIGHCEAQR